MSRSELLVAPSCGPKKTPFFFSFFCFQWPLLQGIRLRGLQWISHNFCFINNFFCRFIFVKKKEKKSMELIIYSCGHISCPHEPIPTKFGLWRFFIKLYQSSTDIWYSNLLKCKKKKKKKKKKFFWSYHFGIHIIVRGHFRPKPMECFVFYLHYSYSTSMVPLYFSWCTTSC